MEKLLSPEEANTVRALASSKRWQRNAVPIEFRAGLTLLTKRPKRLQPDPARPAIDAQIVKLDGGFWILTERGERIARGLAKTKMPAADQVGVLSQVKRDVQRSAYIERCLREWHAWTPEVNDTEIYGIVTKHIGLLPDALDARGPSERLGQMELAFRMEEKERGVKPAANKIIEAPPATTCPEDAHETYLAFLASLPFGSFIKRSMLPGDADDKYKSQWLTWATEKGLLQKTGTRGKYKTTALLNGNQ